MQKSRKKGGKIGILVGFFRSEENFNDSLKNAFWEVNPQ